MLLIETALRASVTAARIGVEGAHLSGACFGSGMAEIWPGSVVEENSLAAQVSLLRKVLRDDPHTPQLLRTVPGRGYQFVAEVKRVKTVLDNDRDATVVPDLDLNPSLVVLPFANLSSDPEQDYFASGITDTITTDLSRISGLVVIASATASAFKGYTGDVRHVCRELGVQFALGGSIQKCGESIRINAQLVDAANAKPLWADRFDGDRRDLFALQDQITGRIANSIGRELIAAAIHHAGKREIGANSTECLLRGIALADKPVSLENLKEQEELFGKAILFDQNSSEAQARFARWVLLQLIWFGASLTDFDREGMVRKSSQSVERAIALDPNNARAHLALGLLHVALGNFSEAALANETAIALDPNLALAHSNLGNCLVHLGKPDEAIAAIERALRLDPRGPQLAAFQCAMGLAHLFRNDAGSAVHWYALARATNQRLARAYAGLAIALAQSGKVGVAQEVARELKRLAPEFRMTETIHSPTVASPLPYRRFYEEVLVPAAHAAGVPV
jgi:TolB-like protein